MSRLLVLGDPHYSKGQSDERFVAAGRMAHAEKVDHIVVMGDLVDMDTLSSFEQVGSKVLEGQRVQDDIEAGAHALRVLSEHSAPRKKRKPQLHFIEGNHEERIKRWENSDVRFAGLVNLERDWGKLVTSFTPYMQYMQIDGVYFTHIPHNKTRPISGSGMTISVAQKVAAMMDSSVVYGHTHQLDIGKVVRNGKQDIVYAFSPGCFFEEENNPHYVAGLPLDWWRGAAVLDIYRHGLFDFKVVSLDRIKEMYL